MRTFLICASTTALALSGCAATTAPDSIPAHDNTDAVVWLQTSAEYAAVTTGIYAAAIESLVEIAETAPVPTSQMAIVLDVDETVLDNSPYQGQLIIDDESYGRESWDRWLALREAVEVPGVVDFIRTSQSLGFHVAFITNRPCRERLGTRDGCPQKEDTLVNLRAIGIETASTTLFLMGERPPEACRQFLTTDERADGTWSSDKTSRRQCLSRDHEIVMLFGDQLGDFVEKHGGDPDRSGRDAAQQTDQWGKTWFMLPNPTYGGWRPRSAEDKRELIQGID